MTAEAPVVDGTAIGPGHDGRAELVVRLRHANGVHSTISVDEEALERLLAQRDVSSIDDLAGRRWPDLTR